MFFDKPTQIDPPHGTQGTALEFLHTHYAEVRKRLMMPAAARRRRIQDMRHYPEPIGPVRVVMGPVPDIAALKTPLKALVGALCADLDVTADDIIGKVRKRHLVKARARICHHLREQGYSLTDVARRMKRDHTTILYLLNTYDRYGERANA